MHNQQLWHIGGYYLKQNKQLGIEISGSIFAEDEHTNIDYDEFFDKFIEFVDEEEQSK